MTETREGTFDPSRTPPTLGGPSGPSGTDPVEPERPDVRGRWGRRWRLLGLASCLPAFGVAIVLAAGGWKPAPQLADAALRVTLSLPTLFFSWWAIVAVFSALVRSARAKTFGASPLPRLIAALLTFAVFPHVPRAAVVGLMWAASELGFALPIHLAGSRHPLASHAAAEGLGVTQQSRVFAAPPGDVPIDGAFAIQIVLDFFEAWRKALTDFGRRLIEQIPIADITAALATWAVLALVLRALAEWKVLARVAKFAAARPHFNWPNVGFVVLLGGGLFLTLAAITSLPRLNEKHRPNSEVSAEALERILTNLQTPREQIERYLPDDLKTDPLGAPPVASDLSAPPVAAQPPPATLPAPGPSDGGSSVKADPNEPPAPSATGGEAMTADDRRRMERHQSEIADDLAKDWSSMRGTWQNVVKDGVALGEAIISVEKQDLSIAVGSYRVQNLDRQGSREEVQHFLDIQSWYAANVDQHRSKLEACTNKIRQAKLELGNWGTRARQVGAEAAKSQANELDAWLLQARVNERLSEPSMRLEVLFYDTQRECSIPRSSPSPARPALGPSLGALHFIAGWLLDVGSLPLALIIGMMGFGLLGSVISTFVRERAQATDSEEPIFISDLTGVVLRGLSAAIVVFLAVQGGLAVLSGAGSDPNPYVLLLVCFVAAVFSENVWLSAHAYFLDKLASITHKRYATANAGGQAGSGGGANPPGSDDDKPADGVAAPAQPATVPGK